MTRDVEACPANSMLGAAVSSAPKLDAPCLCSDGRHLPESKIVLITTSKRLPVPLPHTVLPYHLASTADVQAYLGGLLVHKYNVMLEISQDVVDQCRFQRGWHLRSATLAQFRQFFGKTNGAAAVPRC